MYFSVFQRQYYALSSVVLLLPGIISYEVCLNISDGNMMMKTEDLNVFDKRNELHHCIVESTPCFITCKNMSQLSELFNGRSSMCYPARFLDDGYSFSIDQPPPRPDGTCNAYNCTVDQIRHLLENLTVPGSNLDRLVEMHLLLRMCKELFKSSMFMQKLFIRADGRQIHNIMGEVSQNPGVKTHDDLKYLTMDMFAVADTNLTDSKDLCQIPQTNPAVRVLLPTDALRKIPEQKRLVNVVNYASPQQFQLNDETISSTVVRIEFLEGRRLSNLRTPVTITFQLDKKGIWNDPRLRCGFFDEDEYRWKTDGCFTNRTANVFECMCTHTTAFSVLLIREPIDEVHWKILSIISYIGCGLSAFCTALSIMLYVTQRKQREEPSVVIHVSLSGALFLLNSSFLLSEWGATVTPGWVCVLIAALIHYSLLGTFTWMAVEGLHLYLMLIKVFNTEYKHYLLKLSLFGWGIPAVVVGVTLSLKGVKQVYGITTFTMLDSNQTNSICWISDDVYFYACNVVYFAAVFVFNTGILLIVACRICRLATAPALGPRVGCGTAFTVLGLTCLLGTTWGLAFLGSGYVNYPVQYLFCIFNSMQGVVIFLWILCTAMKERKRAMEARTGSSSSTDSKATMLN